MSPIPWGHETPNCQSGKVIQKCHYSALTSLAFLSFYLTIPEFSDQSFGIWGIIWGKFTKCLDLSWEILLRGFCTAESACLYFCLRTARWIERTHEYRLKENHTVNPSKINSSSRMLHFYFCVGDVQICYRISITRSGSSRHGLLPTPHLIMLMCLVYSS